MIDDRALVDSTTLDDTEYCRYCGTVLDWTDCGICDEGYTFPGQLYEEDPLWYDEDDVERCHQCGGTGGWWVCPVQRCRENRP